MPAWPTPKQFDIVWCKFPYNGHPSAQRHPCLILTIADEQAGSPLYLIVAGGTSANKQGRWIRASKATDFVVQEPGLLKAAGLANATAFLFEAFKTQADGVMTGGSLLTLPYTDDFFVAVAPAKTPVIGKLDLGNAKVKDAFIKAGKAARLRALLEAEQARYATNKDVRKILKKKR
ncbi:MAG: hypothetical protein H7346_18615 [Burkholderiaceae bacterium]|nr:hypothetical protein [Burkholderiaceae bacterium]